MLKLNLFTLIVLLPLIGFSQGDCGMSDDLSLLLNNSPPNEPDHIFYTGDGCDRISIPINFIFINKDESGYGNFPINDGVHDQGNDTKSNIWLYYVREDMNGRLKKIDNEDPNCENGHDGLDHKDALFDFDFKQYWISDSVAWDYASIIENGSPLSCPNGWENSDNDWAKFEELAFSNNYYTRKINGQVEEYVSLRDGINIFFTNNGAAWDYYIDNIDNAATLTESYEEPRDLDDEWTGCSERADGFYAIDEKNIIMLNTGIGYLTTAIYKNLKDQDDKPLPSEDDFRGETAKLIIHEICHTVLNDGHKPDCHNFLNGTPYPLTDRRYLDFEQLEQGQVTLSTSNLHSLIDWEQKQSCSIIIDKVVSWNRPTRVYGDIHITENGHLSITDELFMPPDGKINVLKGGRLEVINGGSIDVYYGCPDGTKWQGIQVDGLGQQIPIGHFDVRFKDATISNVIGTAVSMIPSTWPNTNIGGNGVIEVDNSKFLNCTRAIEFIAYKSSDNPSFIRNNSIVDGGDSGVWGITNWNCKNVKVEDSEFLNIEKECLLTINGSFNAIGNTFDSKGTNISIKNTINGISHDYEKNTFKNGERGILNHGGTIAGVDVVNNKFFSKNKDICLDGSSKYNIKKNDLTAKTGVIVSMNGESSTYVIQNSFTGNRNGLRTEGQNPEFQFIQNCFNTNFIDYINRNGFIPTQGGFDEAGNCFTHNGIESERDIVNFSNQTINYSIYNDGEINCKDVFNPDVTLLNANPNNGFIECGASFFAGGGIGDTNFSDCNPAPNLSAYLQAHNNLTNKIKKIEKGLSLDNSTKSNLLSHYKRCKSKVKGLLGEYYLNQGLYKNAVKVFSTNPSFQDEVNIISIYILIGDYTLASSYLKSMQASSEEETDFIYTQAMNIRYLESGMSYEFPSSNINTLETIANKNYPLSAYAKSLYFLIKGKEIITDFPEIDDDRGKKSIFEDSFLISVYPNPTTGQLSINTDNPDGLLIKLLDSRGSEILKKIIHEGDSSIDISDLSGGIYFLNYNSDRGNTTTKKIIVLSKH